jgi:hypothetical protein
MPEPQKKMMMKMKNRDTISAGRPSRERMFLREGRSEGDFARRTAKEGQREEELP